MSSRSLPSCFARAALTALLLAACAAMTCGVPPASELPQPEATRADMLGPGDVVEVRIFNEPDLSGTHQISDSGTIRLPLVGAVEAAGITPDQLTVKIAGLYNERFLKDAEVSLFVKEHNSRKIYVLGQVVKPGPYAFDGKMTIIDAVALAGGTTQIADPDRTLITRDKDGKQIRVVVRVAAIGEGRSPDILLQPGDIIFVPETPF